MHFNVAEADRSTEDRKLRMNKLRYFLNIPKDRLPALDTFKETFKSSSVQFSNQ